MNRRQFLASTAVGTAALASAQPIGAAISPRWLKAGLLGGAQSHAAEKRRLVGASADCHLVSVTGLLRRHGDRTEELMDNNVAGFEFPKVLGLIVNSTLQPNANRHRVFEVFGANGCARRRPIEPFSLEMELVKPAGPYKAGLQPVPLPKDDRYVGEPAELAVAVRGQPPLNLTLDEELCVHKWLLKACGMMERKA